MNNIVEQKSNLAKLLATENVTVQHQNVQTASFNPKTRVLILPIWKKMSPELYDLLLSHEVGHALWTPAEGWHEAVCDKGRNYKAFLNVIEDARIEKKIKRKYPGLRRSYIKGFAEIMNMNLFGIESFDQLEAFIDRINVFTKSSYSADIDFNAEEQAIIEEIKNLESWDDVINMTNRLWDKAVEEKENEEDFDFPMNGLPSDDFDFSDDDEGEYQDIYDESGEQDSEISNTKSYKDTDEGTDEEPEGKMQSDSEGDGAEDEDSIESQATGTHGFTDGDEGLEPNCETDESFRSNESLLNEKDPKSYQYVTLPKPVLNKILIDAKSINKRMTKHFAKEYAKNLPIVNNHAVEGEHEIWQKEFTRAGVMAEFKKKNDRFISLMAKEFEMKKAATKYAKARLYTSGDIDVNKIYKYKFDDQLFRKLTKLPKGKNHGMILTLDLSGSMSDNLKGSLEQVCILTAFCKKVQIPFRVFGFTSHCQYSDIDSNTQFKHKVGDINFNEDRVFLKEFINSNMSAKDYKNAFENLLLTKNSFDSIGRFSCSYPRDFVLGSTPLNPAILALKEIVTEFKTVNQLDIVNTIFVHDGDSNSLRTYINKEDDPYGSYLYDKEGIIIQDHKTRFECMTNNRHRNDNITHTLLKWLKHSTGTQVFGFFVSRKMTDAIGYRYVTKDNRSWLGHAERKEVIAKARKQKFIESNIAGFDSFFILNDSKKLTTDNEEFEFEVKDHSKINTRSLASQFTKMNKAREVNRVLATQFVQKIAVKL